MSTKKEFQEGVIANLESTGNNNSGDKYQVTFEDGDSVSLFVFKKAEYTPRQGDKIRYYPGPYSDFVFSTKVNGESGNPASAATPFKQKALSKDSYWQQKDQRDANWQDYQIKKRDPKIEFQSYFNNVINLYSAALSTLENPPQNSSDLDNLVNDAWVKAKELYNLANK